MDYYPGFFKDILEHLNMGIFVLDAQGRFLYFNDTYCKIVKKTRDFYIGMSIPKLKEAGYLNMSVWEQVLQKNAPVVALVTITDKELNLVYQCFTSAIPTFYEDGSIKHIFYLVETVENIYQRIQGGTLNRQNGCEPGTVPPEQNVDIIAESPQMKQLLVLLSNVSKTDASILITGPTGSGKEVLAEYAHRMSARNGGPFISVDCASIPENLLEAELFGYERGAFTGANTQGKPGQIEMANGGTLFLDEINSMPVGLQGKLLRVLETRMVKRLGAAEAKPIDFRLLCASNERLEDMVQNGSFRSDLYYRISVVPVQIPPLRERKEDIVPLSFFYLQHFCKKYSRIKVLSEEMIREITSYDWPGNVRELKNFMERIVVTSKDSDLTIDHLSVHAPEGPDSADGKMPAIPEPGQAAIQFYSADFSYRSHMEQCEKRLLQEALTEFKNPAGAAAALKLDLSNVYRKMHKYGL